MSRALRRGGSRKERQAVREWVALFQHEAAVEC